MGAACEALECRVSGAHGNPRLPPSGVKINQKADLRRRPSGHAAFGRVGVPIEPADLRPTRRPDPLPRRFPIEVGGRSPMDITPP
jgi:hypothetical protein